MPPNKILAGKMIQLNPNAGSEIMEIISIYMRRVLEKSPEFVPPVGQYPLGNIVVLSLDENRFRDPASLERRKVLREVCPNPFYYKITLLKSPQWRKL